MIIVGNKTDMANQRVVSHQEGEALAKEFKCAWIECSALTADNVTKAFELLIIEIEKLNEPTEAANNTRCKMM